MSYALVAWWARQPPDARARDRRHGEAAARRGVVPAGGPLRRHDRVGARPVPGAGGARPRRARLHDQRRRRRAIRRCRTASRSTSTASRSGTFSRSTFRRLYWAPRDAAALRDRTSREFDVVHTHAIYLWPLWAAARDARDAAGVPYVVSPRGMLEKDLIEQKSALWKAALIGVRREAQRSSAPRRFTSPAARGGRGRARSASTLPRGRARFRTASISIARPATASPARSPRSSTAGPTCCFSAASTGRRGSID